MRYASWMEEGELEPLDLSNGKGGRSAWQLLRSCHPAHLQHSRVTEDLQDELSLKALVSHAALPNKRVASASSASGILMCDKSAPF